DYYCQSGDSRVNYPVF
nr:immunoglobulin light chain junction region [Macaca mulatta]